MTALAICAALAVSGCAAPSGNQGSLLEPTQRADDTKTDIQVQKPPAYVYYVKEADLMRADVNSDMVPGVNPSVIMEGIGEGAGPRSYYDAMHPAKDGSFLILILRRPGILPLIGESWPWTRRMAKPNWSMRQGVRYIPSCAAARL